MSGNGNRLTYQQRKELKDLVIECRVKRLTRAESLAYVNSKLKLEKPIGIDYLAKIIAHVKYSAPNRMEELKTSRHAFLDEYFMAKDEINEYKKITWQIFYKNAHNSSIQLQCIDKLHQLTITGTNIIDVAPQYSGNGKTYADARNETVSERMEQHPAGTPEIQRKQEDPQAKF